MVCLKSQENMGSTPRALGDGDTDSVSPEELLERTRSPRKPLVFIPRSRSPSDLPGGIRVPVLRKPESRLRARLEENLAGLKELDVLREKHQIMIKGATRTEHVHLDHMHKTLSSSLQGVNYGGLSIITEEVRPGRKDAKQNFRDQSLEFCEQSDENYIDADDSHFSTPERNSPNPSDINETKFHYGSGLQLSKNPNFDASESFPSPQYFTSRRSSVQCIPHRMTTPVGLPRESQIRPKLRRASFQCETIMTKQSDRETPSKVISDFKLHCSNDTSPLHAITRQYASSANLKSSESNLEVIETPVSTKDPQKVLQDWLKESQNSNLANSHKQQNKIPENKLVDNVEKVSSEEHDKGDNIDTTISRHGLCGNVREQSFTSDYYGSVETINSVQSLPARVTNPRMRPYVSDVNDARIPSSSQYNSHRRRHSLPTNALLRQRLPNSAGNTNSSSKNNQTIKDSNVYKQRTLCPDDDVFRDAEIPVNSSTQKLSRRASSTGNSTTDEGFDENVIDDKVLKNTKVIKSNDNCKTTVSKLNTHGKITAKHSETELPKQRKPLLETAL